MTTKICITPGAGVICESLHYRIVELRSVAELCSQKQAAYIGEVECLEWPKNAFLFSNESNVFKIDSFTYNNLKSQNGYYSPWGYTRIFEVVENVERLLLQILFSICDEWVTTTRIWLCCQHSNPDPSDAWIGPDRLRT